jgi:CRP-like cAMP-binding protein
MKPVNTPIAPTTPPPVDWGLEEQISSHPFCHSLPAEFIPLLASCAMKVHFHAGETIFKDGDPANRFYLIQSGRVDIRAGGHCSEPFLIASIKAGDVLGWSWLFPPYFTRFSAEAAEETEALFFYGTRLRQVCAENSRFGYEILKRVCAIAARRLLQCTAKLPPVITKEVIPTFVEVPVLDEEQAKLNLDMFLVGHPLFRNMSPEYRRIIRDTATERVYDPRESIFRAGGSAFEFFLLKEGHVAITNGRSGEEVQIQVIEPGQVFGWSWLFAPYAWHFHARAIDRARVIVLDGARLLVACEENPSFGYALLQQVAHVIVDRLQTTRKQLLALQLEPA